MKLHNFLKNVNPHRTLKSVPLTASKSFSTSLTEHDDAKKKKSQNESKKNLQISFYRKRDAASINVFFTRRDLIKHPKGNSSLDVFVVKSVR